MMFFLWKGYYWYDRIIYGLLTVFDGPVMVFSLGFYGAKLSTDYIFYMAEKDCIERIKQEKR